MLRTNWPDITTRCDWLIYSPDGLVQMSGVSFKGGTSRCFYDWQKFIDCYTAKDTSDLGSCRLFAEDYAECLHHTKEKQRAIRIRAELDRKQAAGDDTPELKTQKHLKSSLQDLNLIK